MNTKNMQSANTLFKFMSELKYLENIVQNKAIPPRYCDEDISYLEWEEASFISFPMVCFCDIRLSRVLSHVDTYGKFAIGLNKEWGLQQGIQPLLYINPTSEFCSKFKQYFHNAIEDSTSSQYQNFLVYNLLYQKPYNGFMPVKDKNDVDKTIKKNKNFQDEQEWRYINTAINNEVNNDFMITSSNILEHRHRKCIDIYNKIIAKNPKYWLKFQYDDVKYLLVASEKDKNLLIQFINDKLDCDNNEKLKLASKIFTINNIQEDVI